MKSTSMTLHKSDLSKARTIANEYDKEVIIPLLVSANNKAKESSDVSALLSREPNEHAEDCFVYV